MPRRRAALFIALLLGALVGASPARAADLFAEMQRVTFASASDMGSGERLELVGHLSRPDGPGPFPAVVLLHGCGGLRPNTAVWRRFFTERGYAILAIDSFGPRGVAEICRNAGAVTWSMRAADAFGALDHLVKQPFIQADSVLVMGFSHGAGIALDVVSSHRLNGKPNGRPDGTPRFRAALALYPACAYKARQTAEYRAPVFIGIGTEDDWTPARFCEELLTKHRGTAPMELRLYPEAAHSFDNLDRPATYLRTVLNRNSPTGRGATVGGSPEALAAAQADLDRFLATARPGRG
ncbi:dienelactone hydrolase family protein [Azospirillum sp. sgz302134]